jgi:predicted nucleic acid-binding protein
MKIFVDTTAWYGFFVQNDQFHTKATEYFSSQPKLTTSGIVIEETLALMHHRVGKREAVMAGQLVHQMCDGSIWYITAKENDEIIHLYRSTPRYIDYVDTSIIWLCRKLELPVFTFDAHFKKMGLTIVP